jgi:hypothetical protein
MKHTLAASLFAIAIADCSKIEQVLRICALLAPIVVAIVHAIRRPPRREHKEKRSVKRVASTLPLILLALALMPGCTSLDVARTVQALGQNTNAVSVQVRSPWGSIDVQRNVKP